MSHPRTEVDVHRIRSIMETPILDDRKWAKVPSIPADCFILDLEDSVVPQHKEVARARVVEYLSDPSYFDGRPVIARPNNLATPWGHDDVAALAGAGVTLMAYPKARSVAELRDVQLLLRDHGAEPALLPIIETAGAVLDVAAIAALDGVVGLFTGIGDLSVDAGIAFRTPAGQIHPSLDLARSMLVFACSAFGRAATDTVFVQDIRNLDEAAGAIRNAGRAGYSSLATFYPPHIELINDLLVPRHEEIEEATEILARYEDALAAGKPAVVLEDGRSILALDYARAQRLLERASQR